MGSKGYSAAEHQQVAAADAQVCLQGQQRQSHRGQRHAEDRVAPRRPAQEDSLAQRHQRHRKPGDEARLGRCGLAQSEGLKSIAGEEGQADQHARQPAGSGDFSRPRARRPAEAVTTSGTAAQEERQQRQRGQREAEGEEREDGKTRHRILHHDKRRAPDGRDQQQRGVGGQLLAAHGQRTMKSVQ